MNYESQQKEKFRELSRAVSVCEKELRQELIHWERCQKHDVDKWRVGDELAFSWRNKNDEVVATVHAEKYPSGTDVKILYRFTIK